MAEVQTDMILTQSIALVLFTVDKQAQIPDIDICRQTFGKTPWRFHHITELNTTQNKTNKILARQEFHELTKDIPLFSMSSNHFGRRIIRFNLFTYNYTKMSEFYEALLNMKPDVIRDDLSIFTFPEDDLLIQIALKKSTKVMPYALSKAQLVLQVPQFPDSLENIQKVNDDCQWLCDPDSNILVLQKSSSMSQTTSAGGDLQVNEDIDSLKMETECNDKDVITEPDDLLYKSDPKKLKELLDDETPPTRRDIITQRPDVIPAREPLDPTEPVKQTTRTFVKLGHHATSKTNTSVRKLNISVSAYSISNTEETGGKQTTSNSELNNNHKLPKLLHRRDSVDVLASF